jgi:uncharacterized protein YraI
LRTKIAVLIIAVLCLFAVIAPALAQDGPVASVNTAYLNVRSGPGLGYGSIATLPRGFGVQLLGRNSAYNWVLIGMTNGVQGWVNINYIYTTTSISSLPLADNVAGTPIDPAGTITGFFIAELRSGPNEANPVIATAPGGTNVQLVGRNFDASWALIRLPDGTTGWVPASAVTSTVPVRALSPRDGSVYAPPAPVPSTPGGSTSYETYVIQPGDTLLGIATQFGVNLYQLAALNGIYNINRIYWGQTLLIPS